MEYKDKGYRTGGYLLEQHEKGEAQLEPIRKKKKGNKGKQI